MVFASGALLGFDQGRARLSGASGASGEQSRPLGAPECLTSPGARAPGGKPMRAMVY